MTLSIDERMMLAAESWYKTQNSPFPKEKVAQQVSIYAPLFVTYIQHPRYAQYFADTTYLDMLLVQCAVETSAFEKMREQNGPGKGLIQLTYPKNFPLVQEALFKVVPEIVGTKANPKLDIVKDHDLVASNPTINVIATLECFTHKDMVSCKVTYKKAEKKAGKKDSSIRERKAGFDAISKKVNGSAIPPERTEYRFKVYEVYQQELAKTEAKAAVAPTQQTMPAEAGASKIQKSIVEDFTSKAEYSDLRQSTMPLQQPGVQVAGGGIASSPQASGSVPLPEMSISVAHSEATTDRVFSSVMGAMVTQFTKNFGQSSPSSHPTAIPVFTPETLSHLRPSEISQARSFDWASIPSLSLDEDRERALRAAMEEHHNSSFSHEFTFIPGQGHSVEVGVEWGAGTHGYTKTNVDPIKAVKDVTGAIKWVQRKMEWIVTFSDRNKAFLSGDFDKSQRINNKLLDQGKISQQDKDLFDAQIRCCRGGDKNSSRFIALRLRQVEYQREQAYWFQSGLKKELKREHQELQQRLPRAMENEQIASIVGNGVSASRIEQVRRQAETMATNPRSSAQDRERGAAALQALATQNREILDALVVKHDYVPAILSSHYKGLFEGTPDSQINAAQALKEKNIPELMPTLCLIRGSNFQAAGKNDLAEQEFSETLRYESGNEKALSGLAHVYHDEKKYRELSKVCDQLAQQYPHVSAYQSQREESYCLELNACCAANDCDTVIRRGLEVAQIPLSSKAQLLVDCALAWAYREKGDSTKESEAVARVLAADSENEVGLSLHAGLCADKKDPRTEVETREKLARLKPENFAYKTSLTNARKKLIQTLDQEGTLASQEEALSEQSKVAQSEGHTVDDVINYSQRLQKSGRNKEAIACLRSCDRKEVMHSLEEQAAKTPENALLYARFLYESGNVVESLSYYRKYLEGSPDQAAVRKEFKDALIKEGSPASLEEAAYNHMMIAQSLGATLDDAIDGAHFLQGVGRDQEAMNCLSHFSSEDFKQALVRRADPSPTDNLLLARLLNKEGHLSESIACYRKYLSDTPDALFARREFVGALVKEGSPVSLQEAGEQQVIIATSPMRTVDDLDLAVDLCIELGRDEDAIKFAQEYLNAMPNDINRRCELRDLYLKMNRRVEAIEQQKIICSKEPGELMHYDGLLSLLTAQIQENPDTSLAEDVFGYLFQNPPADSKEIKDDEQKKEIEEQAAHHEELKERYLGFLRGCSGGARKVHDFLTKQRDEARKSKKEDVAKQLEKDARIRLAGDFVQASARPIGVLVHGYSAYNMSYIVGELSVQFANRLKRRWKYSDAEQLLIEEQLQREAAQALSPEPVWNSFDTAVGLHGSREDRQKIVDFALAHSEDSNFRDLLLPEIRSSLLEAVAAKDAEVNHEAIKAALPASMRTEESQGLCDRYIQATVSLDSIVEEYRKVLQRSDEEELTKPQLDLLLQEGKDTQLPRAQELKARYEQICRELQQAETALSEFCSKKETYERYVRDYYTVNQAGKGGCFVFRGETSMIDIVALMPDVNKPIAIYHGAKEPYRAKGAGVDYIEIACDPSGFKTITEPNISFYSRWLGYGVMLIRATSVSGLVRSFAVPVTQWCESQLRWSHKTSIGLSWTLDALAFIENPIVWGVSKGMQILAEKGADKAIQYYGIENPEARALIQWGASQAASQATTCVVSFGQRALAAREKILEERSKKPTGTETDQSKPSPAKTEDNPPKGLLTQVTEKAAELKAKADAQVTRAATGIARAELWAEGKTVRSAQYVVDKTPQCVRDAALRVGSASKPVVNFVDNVGKTGGAFINATLDRVHRAEQAIDHSVGHSLEAFCPTAVLNFALDRADGIEKTMETMDRYHADLVITTVASAVGYFRGAKHAFHTLPDDNTLLQSAKAAQATAKNEEDDHDIRSATIPGTEERYYEIDTDGDGDCLFCSVILDALLPTVDNKERFSAIYQQLFGDQPAGANEALRQSLSHYDGTIKYLIQSNPSLSRLVHHAMRPNIATYLREHRAEFEQHFAQAAEIPADKETFEQHLDRLLRPGYWGGEHELRALSHLLQCRIIVYHYNDAGNLASVQVGAYGDEYTAENTIRLAHVEQRYVMCVNGTACAGKRNHYHFLLSERQLPQSIHLPHTEQGQAPHTEAMPSAAPASPSMTTASGSGLFERHPPQTARSHVEEAANREETSCKKTA